MTYYVILKGDFKGGYIKAETDNKDNVELYFDRTHPYLYKEITSLKPADTLFQVAHINIRADYQPEGSQLYRMPDDSPPCEFCDPENPILSKISQYLDTSVHFCFYCGRYVE